MNKNAAVAILLVAAVAGTAVWIGGKQNTNRTNTNAASTLKVGPTVPFDESSASSIAEQMSGDVKSLLHTEGWTPADIGAVCTSLELAVPVLAGTAIEPYLDQNTALGLTPNERPLRARLEKRTSSPRWEQIREQDGAPDPPTELSDIRDVQKFLLETDPVFKPIRLESVDLGSVRISERRSMQLEDNQNVAMVSALSHEWTNANTTGAGLSVEFVGRFTDGRPVRVHMLFAKVASDGPPTWGLAACAFVSEASAPIPTPPF